LVCIVELVIFAAKPTGSHLLDKIKNDITCETPASFEPAIDYAVIKIPRFAFGKFPQLSPSIHQH